VHSKEEKDKAGTARGRISGNAIQSAIFFTKRKGAGDIGNDFCASTSFKQNTPVRSEP